MAARNLAAEVEQLRGDVSALAQILRRVARREHLGRPQDDGRNQQPSIEEDDIEALTEIERRAGE